MKKNIYILILLLISLSSCVDSLLDKPLGSDLRIDSIFANREKALGAIAYAYDYGLMHGAFGNDWGTLADISGENLTFKHTWEDSYAITRSGMIADRGGSALSDDQFYRYWWSIRHSYLVFEHIDNVPDMNANEKNSIKGEMLALIAYRYVEMFKRYGGVPIVTKSLSIVEDDVRIPRGTLEETLTHIITLCDEALKLLPDTQPDINKGRANKGFAHAIKAEALLFAARPLFNSSSPYLDLGENNKLICFGTHDENRWRLAAEAAEEVIRWATSFGYEIINTGNPMADFGNAVATPGNKEYIMVNRNIINPENYDIRIARGHKNAMSFQMLSKFYKANGEDQDWPNIEEFRPYSDYYSRIQEMEPRYKVSAMGAGIDAWNNPNDDIWNSRNITYGDKWVDIAQNEGSGRPVKFWYMAGSRRWFEFPIYRLAEFYLDAAEAFNEVGQTSKAHQYLNVIRNRAGLPNITEMNKDRLREIIQRERAIELYWEEHRYFDVKHWKLENIGNGIIGGDMTTLFWFYIDGWDHAPTPSEYRGYTVRRMYSGFWNQSQYLNPFPSNEINKGYLIQNPGY